MSAVIHRNLFKTPPVAVAAEGSWYTDRSGRRYIDAHSGGAVCCIGQGHPRVVEAVAEQVRTLHYAHGNHFTSEPLEMLADRLIADAPDNFGWVYVGTGGSECVEAAMKLSRQYWVDAGRPEKHTFIGREGDYHGATLGALAVGGNVARRALFDPMLPSWSTMIAPCYPRASA